METPDYEWQLMLYYALERHPNLVRGPDGVFRYWDIPLGAIPRSVGVAAFEPLYGRLPSFDMITHADTGRLAHAVHRWLIERQDQ